MLSGRLTRWKGQIELVEALTRLRDLSFLCLLVGSDQGRAGYRAEIERLVAKHDLSSRVFLPGQCDDMPAAYMLADIVVCASTDPEAFGRVVSEAQAMGCPVVASNHGGVPEQVLDGRTAFLFPPGDREALARALRETLALGAPQRELLSLAARTHARANFSKDKMCQATLALYREVLQSAPREAPAPVPGQAARSGDPAVS
jgi:glycosyltransferase involved in cell wall biosynthesis